MDEQRPRELISPFNEKALLDEMKIALAEQHEEFLAQTEELNAAVEELMAKNNSLTAALMKLQQRNQELDQILYHASHDLKAPVSSIYGLINVLRSVHQTSDQQMATNYLGEQARLMNLKLDGLTKLSNAFFKEPQPAQYSIREIVMSAWRTTERPSAIKLFAQEEDESIVTDLELMKVAIGCLFDNAVTYRKKPEGKITVTWSKSDNLFALVVSDDGDGVDPNISDKMFNMFYRGSERSKGAGLGLYIVKIIADKLGGSIQHIPCSNGAEFKLSLSA